MNMNEWALRPLANGPDDAFLCLLTLLNEELASDDKEEKRRDLTLPLHAGHSIIFVKSPYLSLPSL